VAKGRIAAVARVCIHYDGRACLTQKCSFLWRNLDPCLITKFLEPCKSAPKQRKHWQPIHVSDYLYESTLVRRSKLQRRYSQICSVLGHIILLSFFAILVEWINRLFNIGMWLLCRCESVWTLMICSCIWTILFIYLIICLLRLLNFVRLCMLCVSNILVILVNSKV